MWTWAYGFCTDAAPMCEITKDASQNKLTIKYQGAKDAKVQNANYTDPPGASGPWQYTVKNANTKNITYSFTLGAKLAGNTQANVTIEYGHIFAEGFSGTAAEEPPKVESKDLNPADLTADSIKSITVTDKDGNKTTYNKDPKGPDAPGITITKKDRNTTTATFKKNEGTTAAPEGPANSIILEYTKDDKNGTIKITGKQGAPVPFGHILAEGFDNSTVRWEINSPTLMVIVGIMKSQKIYDPYVFMGNWGGSHGPVTADGDLKLTINNGSYDTNSGNEITLAITGATYTNKRNSADLVLSLSGTSNTLLLTSGTPITTGGGPYTLNRKTNGLTLNLNGPDPNFTPGTYNVSLNIEGEITLSSSSNIKLKSTNSPVSLGTYIIGGGDTNFTGTPDTNDIHSNHETTKCCIFGKQNTWSTNDNRYGWHSFIISIPIKNFLPSILYIHFITENHTATDAAPICEINVTGQTKLTIKYTTTNGTEKVKTATLNSTNGTRIGNKYKYTATYDTSKIRYNFTTTAATLATGTTTDTVTIEYGHIFVEGFGGWKQYISTHVDKNQKDHYQKTKIAPTLKLKMFMLGSSTSLISL